MADRKLIVKIVGDSSSLERAYGRAGAASRGFATNVGVSIATLAKGVLVVDAIQKALEGLHATIHLGIEEFSEHAKVTAQTTSALKSTASIAGVTAKQIDELGLSLSNLSGVDDEVVQAGENILLSFTKIRNQVGKGNDIFTRATKDALDFATRTGRDVPTAARILGVALENPARKATALSRAGIVLTANQLKLIKALQQSGNALAAQKLILDEVEKRFKGAAAAAGTTLPGQLNILRDRFKDLAGSGIGLIAPATSRAVKAVTDLVKKISETKGAKAKFQVAFTGLEQIGRDLLRQISDVLSRINWDQAGASLAGFSRSVQERLSRFVDGIDWQDIGKRLADGIGKAFVILFNFVKTVLPASLRLAFSILKGLAAFTLGLGKEIGKALIRGIVIGIEELGRLAEIVALKIVLKIVKAMDFSLPLIGHVIPGVDKLVKTIQAKIDSLHGKTITINVVTKSIGDRRNFDPKAAATTAAARAPQTVKPLDTSLGLIDTGAAAASAASAAASAADKAAKALQRLLDTLNLAVAKAGLTKTLKDDVAANQALITALREQIKLHKDDLSLQNDLVSAQQARLALVQQQRDAELAARNARQFKTLGLDATGQALVPLKQGLARELRKVTADVSGSFLDTSKTQKMLKAISKLILNPFTKVSKDVRTTIKQMLDDIEAQLKNRSGNLTKGKVVSTDRLLGGLGLDRDTFKKLQARLSKVTTDAHLTRSGGALAGAGGITVVTHNVTTLDGKVLEQSTTRHQQVRRRRNPPQRR